MITPYGGLDPVRAQADMPEAIKKVSALSRIRRLREAELCADAIACGADVLWAEKLPRRAEVRPEQVHEAVVCGIALLAHRHSGATFGGLHWCTAKHDDCPGIGEWTLPERSLNRSARGAFFTPRELAEEVAWTALEDCVYRPGPLQTADRSQWRVKPSSEILALKVGDIAVGSGVFLLAACRYLAARLVEAWHHESGHLPAGITVYDPIACAARRQVMRCLYGADIDPTSVELARLALALLAPTVPLDLTGHIVCGDSLLGVTSLDQIAAMHIDPAKSILRAPIIDPELLRLLAQVDARVYEDAI